MWQSCCPTSRLAWLLALSPLHESAATMPASQQHEGKVNLIGRFANTEEFATSSSRCAVLATRRCGATRSSSVRLGRLDRVRIGVRVGSDSYLTAIGRERAMLCGRGGV